MEKYPDKIRRVIYWDEEYKRKFIFFTKAGQYTREEFGVARQRFLETGKPKIYTYFKVLGDETRMRILLSLEGGEMCVCDIKQYVERVALCNAHQFLALGRTECVV